MKSPDRSKHQLAETIDRLISKGAKDKPLPMAIIESWMPPSRENWDLLLWLWQLYPIFPSVQWLVTWYPMGKTSIDSRFNIPGRIAWILMELPGVLVLLYLMFALPARNGISNLPMANWLMAGLFTSHYIYRAVIGPLLNPSISPIHPFVFLSAIIFQLVNATCIGGWLASYGPLTSKDWEGRAEWIEVGMVIFGLGLLSNIYHDDELREIRRAAARNHARNRINQGKRLVNESVAKVYMIPENGLFRLVLYPHYLSEWIEWCGFWMIGGLGCVPARCFVINEVAVMLPRAVNGRQWYIERFGKEKIGARKAVIPWAL